MPILRELLFGFAFGIANIIPGVSGGTFALILGFYERLIGFLNRLEPKHLKEMLQRKFRWLRRPLDRETNRAFWGYLREHDWFFMLRLMGGALASIYLLSGSLKYLLKEQFEPTYAFFFGLILFSVAVPWKLIKRRGLTEIAFLLLGATLTIWLTLSVNPADKIKSKSANYQGRYELQEAAVDAAALPEAAPSERLQYTGKYSGAELGIILVSGMLAVSAMVLPGISGSLILILLGQYITVISAIANLKSLLLDEFLLLGIFAIGLLVGILITARLVEVALRKAHDGTMAFLTGLIIGSLYTLWPFKTFETLDLFHKESGRIVLEKSVQVYSNQNILPPGSFSSWGPAVGMALLGSVCMILMLKYDPDIAEERL